MLKTPKYAKSPKYYTPTVARKPAAPTGDTQNNELLERLMFTVADLQSQLTKVKNAPARMIPTVIPSRPVRDGRTPTTEELKELIRSLIPKVKDGKTPIPGIDFEIPRHGRDGRSAKDIDVEKVRRDIESGLEQKVSAWRNQLARGYLHGGGVPSLSAGANITLTPKNDGGYTVSAAGLSAVVYSESPVGVINGSNTIFTVTNTISVVIGFWLNGQYIHPSLYGTSGTTITFNTAPPAGLSGKPFTIVYA